VVTDPRVPSASSARDGRASARTGMAAARQYLSRYPAPPGPDFAAAERDLESALRELADGDPTRVAASFMLGAIRIADHETRCAQPCPEPAELAPIVALLAAGGARDGAGPDQLYPYAMAVDKLYDHTHDPADIDLAIIWLSRAATHRRTPAADRRRAQIALAVQHANRGAVTREAEQRSGPGAGRPSAPRSVSSKRSSPIWPVAAGGRTRPGMRTGLTPCSACWRPITSATASRYRTRTWALWRRSHAS
jgi:hypothetical protein